MKHNYNTMENYGEPIVVNGKTQHYIDGTVKRHGKNKDGSSRKVRSDSQML